jgi:CRISPR-associated protein Cas1
MATLYVIEQGARIEKEHRRIVVAKEDQVLLAVPLLHVDHVVLVGNVGATTPALHALLDAGIGMTLLDRWGRLRGRLESGAGKNIVLRHQQYRWTADANFCLTMGRGIVAGKLRNQRTMARRIARTHAVTAAPLERLNRALNLVEGAPDLAALRGLEGEGARCYFAVLRCALRREFDFDRRTRRPPGDPVNALLSLGYTLLGQNLMAACEVSGLDPYDGFFHTDHYGSPGLALDLMEEFRSIIVDSLVLNLVNRRRVQASDFEPGPEGGVYLKRRALRVFFDAYSARINTEVAYAPAGRQLTYQKLFEVQARCVRRAIEEGRPVYNSYLTR